MTEGLRLEGVVRRYGSHLALDDVTIEVPANAYVSLLGPSGSGKTVLLRVIAGFEPPDEGQIWFGGRRIDGVPAHMRGIGFVFQNFALFPHLTVHDNIAFGLRNRVAAPVTDRRVVAAKVAEMVGLVGLTGLEQRGVHQISGGQRQRVALARTLVTEPRLVLLDEPLGALDANLRLRMRAELRRIREQLGVSFLHVTGSESEALAMGDRVVVLNRGRVGQFTDPDSVYNQPASVSVARFLNCYNIFEGDLVDGRTFVGPSTFPVAPGQPRPGTPAYCIRHDLIAIRAADMRPAGGEAGIPAVFIASEYSGNAVTYFFQLDNGQTVDVEAHLSHRAPEDLQTAQRYNLTWRADDALVFA